MTAKDFIFMHNVEAKETEWLWYPYIPQGKITVLLGDPGEGKSSLALSLAAAITRGEQFPEMQQIGGIRYVICQNGEDGLSDTIKPRLERAGAECQYVAVIREDDTPLSLLDERLHEGIEMLRPKLVIIDPLQGFLGDGVDMHRANEIRPIMAKLAETAEYSNAAILLIGHLNKAFSAGKALYRGLGSIDLVAAARSVLLLAKDPEHPENRVLMQLKNSLAALGNTVGFTINEDGIFTYLGDYEISEETLLTPRAEKRESMKDKAKKLIAEWMLREEPLYARDIYLLADSEGISKEVLMRVKTEMHIRSEKTKDGWIWKTGGFKR